MMQDIQTYMDTVFHVPWEIVSPQLSLQPTYILHMFKPQNNRLGRFLAYTSTEVPLQSMGLGTFSLARC